MTTKTEQGWHKRTGTVRLAERLEPETLLICQTSLAVALGGVDPDRIGRIARIIQTTLNSPAPANLSADDAAGWFLSTISDRIADQGLADHLLRQLFQTVHEARTSPGPN